MKQNQLLAILDHPAVLRAIFHPRRATGAPLSTKKARLLTFDLETGISLGGRLYPADREAPLILLFHGNGEIAADYDDLAPLYTRLDISLLVVDYRGYGRSTGAPTVRALLADAVQVFERLPRILAENGLAPAQLYVMGRSLGSAAALEAALHAGERLAGVIIESGFADTFALLVRLGLRVPRPDQLSDGIGNAAKIAQITTRTLVIHGENDALIPAADGQTLYQRCAAQDKWLVLIPGAGHNDLMLVGRRPYFNAIRAFVHPER